MKKKLRVVVLMGGRNSEYDVSISSGREVLKHLNKNKYEIFSLVVPQKGNFDVNSFLALQPDFVFIAMHGKYGEDGTIQGLLEFLGIPYLGAGVLASALGMDKILFRKLMGHEGISSPQTVFVNKSNIQYGKIKIFGFPLVVKPSRQGSSIGVSIVKNKEGLEKAFLLAFKYDENILAEEYLKGTEVTCGVLGNKKPIALPVVEIIPRNEFFNYESKYDANMCEEIVPARISDKLTKKVQETAVRVYQSIGCRGFGRVDMIIGGGVPYVLEINTIPGLTSNSLLPKSAAAAGIGYSELLDRLISLSLEDKEI